MAPSTLLYQPSAIALNASLPAFLRPRCTDCYSMLELSDAWKRGAETSLDILLPPCQYNLIECPSLLDAHGVPRELDYLSIDLDTVDVFVLDAILSSHRYRPRVISVEYNPNFPWGHALTFPDVVQWLVEPWSLRHWPGFRSCYTGASASAIDAVGRAHGYTLVALVDGLDAFLVRDDLTAALGPRFAGFDGGSVPPVRAHGPMRCVEAAQMVDLRVWRRARRDETGPQFCTAQVGPPPKYRLVRQCNATPATRTA